MAIRYEAFTWSGEKVSGVLETDSEADAYEKLQQEQLIPYRLAAIRPRRPLVRLAPSLFKPKPKDIIDFTRQLASLIESGIPLLRALSAQYDQTKNAGLKYAIEDVIERVQAGDRLSEATSRHPSVFPSSYSRLLRITEETGGIGETLRQLADSMEKNKAVKDRVKGALMYPAITLFLAIGAIFVLVKFSLPSLVNMLEDFGGEMPATTRLMITITDGLEGSSLNILIIGGLVVGLTILYTRSAQGARRRDGLLLRLPVIGNVLVASNMFFFTSSFVTLLEAGIAPIEALRLTGQGMTNAVFREQLATATAKASEGMRLGDAFAEQEVFPPLLAQSFAIGEMRGTQADSLRALAAYYENQTQQSIGIMVELIQPTITILVAGVVGFMAVAVISGIYSALNSIE